VSNTPPKKEDTVKPAPLFLLVVLLLAGFTAAPAQTAPSICPIKGKTASDVSGDFGPRTHPVLKVVQQHDGIDIDVPVGTPVLATARGKVFLAGPKEGYGLEIELVHGGGFRTLYAHLSKVIVAPGATVKKGEVIGYSGRSGLASTAHLHYEVVKDGKRVDPKPYFGPPSRD